MDIPMRLLAETASKYLGQNMIVVNVVGAGGSVAAANLLSSPADGYKLIQLDQLFFATIVKTQKIPFNPNDIVPIANFMIIKMGMVVRTDSPWKTLEDLLNYGKKNPGKLRWGHVGRGTSLHLNGLLLFKKAGIETIEIPYKGAAETVPALLGGHLDAAPMTYLPVKDHIKTGKLRYLVTFSDRRYSDPPNVPSAVELGFPEVSKLQTLFGVYAHKNTPADVKKVLFDVLRKAFDDLDSKKEFENIGVEPFFAGPETIREAIKKSEEVGVPMLKELGLYVQ
jgi:tripartite-type tricarboxylate transporter receptor subunit TctC